MASSLRIFANDPQTEKRPRQSYADDVVGRFRSGHVVNGNPQSLEEFRVTTGDPAVAESIYDLLGGDAPQKWEAKGEDDIEIFTAAASVNIIIPDSDSLQQRLVLWGRSGKPIYTTDGETKDDGTPDPDAHLTIAERKELARQEKGPAPDIQLFFRLADEPDLGIFKFQTGSWSLVTDLERDGVNDELADLRGEGPIKATLKLERVEYTAKNGPRAGKLVSYVKPVLKIHGKA